MYAFQHDESDTLLRMVASGHAPLSVISRRFSLIVNRVSKIHPGVYKTNGARLSRKWKIMTTEVGSGHKGHSRRGAAPKALIRMNRQFGFCTGVSACLVAGVIGRMRSEPTILRGRLKFSSSRVPVDRRDERGTAMGLEVLRKS